MALSIPYDHGLISPQLTVWQSYLKNAKTRLFTHTPKAGLLGMIAARLASVRCRVYTCHGLPAESESGLKRQLLIWAERVSCASANQVLAVSQSLLNLLGEHKICSEKKLTVLANGTACGVDLNRFSLTRELIEAGRAVRRNHSISTDETVIGFIGRLVPDKGIHILVESFVRLCESNPNVRLLIIGDFEPHRGRLPDKTTQALSNHPRIVHVGFTHQIEPYYAAMDMLVLPTRREGFPYTILEAAAMGLPVVATEVTGCVDAVLEGRTGFLVPPEDVTALTAVIQKLLASPRLRQQMGCEGTKRVEEEFTSQRLLDAHVQLYRGMLGL